MRLVIRLACSKMSYRKLVGALERFSTVVRVHVHVKHMGSYQVLPVRIGSLLRDVNTNEARHLPTRSMKR